MTAAPATEPPFAAAAPRVFTIDPGRPFLTDLAARLDAALGPALPEARIYVPTRRAARGLADAFRAAASARGVDAVLLPRIAALGDVDDDEHAAFAGPGAAAREAAPAVSKSARRMTLARLVAAKDRAFAGHENWPAAFAAAGELGKLLDSFYAEEVPFAALDAIAPEGFAAHWKRSLDFLEIVTAAWPAYLQEIGRTDPAARQSEAVRAEIKFLRGHAGDTPVVVAGTTGSAPAVADLIGCAASLPRGVVVLPGVDRALAADAAGWAAIDASHPQAGLKALLERIDVAPDAVRPWRAGTPEARARLLSLALRPAEATSDWLDQIGAETARDPGLAAACDGLTLIEAADENEEASVIALAFREALETPGRTAMLITPDRLLALRVAARMRRWGVVVDDSGGAPFANTPCGTYLRLVADWLAAP
ncbi:MAG: double-strand break repair protein AddB, partial [Pseudomonadota bacterium]